MSVQGLPIYPADVDKNFDLIVTGEGMTKITLWGHTYLYKMYLQAIQKLLNYFSFDQSGGLTN